jgi:c-di-GMP-binding flagellar brake protein YcgR
MPRRERRRSPRYPVNNVFGTIHMTVPARLRNLSLSGMAIEVQAPLRIGRSYSVRLRHAEGEELTLTGVVVWCHLRSVAGGPGNERQPLYEAGVNFPDTLGPVAQRLLSFLERSAMVDTDRRIFGRFRVRNRSVSIAADHELVVRTISAHGMLVETSAMAEVGARLEMELELNGERVSVLGRVAFVRDIAGEEGQRRSELGIEFLELGPAEREAILAFISRLLR